MCGEAGSRVARPDAAMPEEAVPVDCGEAGCGDAGCGAAGCGDAGGRGEAAWSCVWRGRFRESDPARQELWKTNVSSHGNKSFERLVSARKTKVFRRGCPYGEKQTKNCFSKRFVFGRKTNVS